MMAWHQTGTTAAKPLRETTKNIFFMQVLDDAKKG